MFCHSVHHKNTIQIPGLDYGLCNVVKIITNNDEGKLLVTLFAKNILVNPADQKYHIFEIKAVS